MNEEVSNRFNIQIHLLAKSVIYTNEIILHNFTVISYTYIAVPWDFFSSQYNKYIWDMREH